MKKNPKEYDKLTTIYYDNIKEKGLSYNLCNYVWQVLVGTSRGYGFNLSHTLAYSLIALQEMNLAYRYPILFWNCACLINDAGGTNASDNEEEIDVYADYKEETYSNEMEEFTEDDEEEDSYDEDEDCDGYPSEVIKTKDGKKKKKTKVSNYGKIASAIGKMASTGVIISAPNINESTYTFSPDIEHNAIRFGLSGITRIGEDLIRSIITLRPYTNLNDFISKVKCNKPQIINLIKCGAFDCFGDRIQIMKDYIASVSDTKKRVTLQNLKMLIDFKLIPDEFDLQCRIFNFSKYLKKINKETKKDILYLDNISFNFYSQYCDIDKLKPTDLSESGFCISAATWETIYQKHMDKLRPFVKANATDLLNKINNRLISDTWNKYCTGSISKWEMDSISCYIHEHELAPVYREVNEFVNFEDLPEVPEIDRYYPIKGKLIPIYKIRRICGTVLDRDKTKKTITLLTQNGVVLVKIYGELFANYDKQISERGADGKKHVIRKSEFSRGNKIIVTGIRIGDDFLAKKYSKTPYHLVETIEQIAADGQILTYSRNSEA